MGVISFTKRKFKKFDNFLGEVKDNFSGADFDLALEPILGEYGYEDEEVFATQVSTTPLVELPYPNTIKDAVLRASLQGSNVSEEILDALLNGTAASFRNYINRHSTSAIFSEHRLVSLSSYVNLNNVQPILNYLANEPTRIITNRFETPTFYEWVIYTLQTEYGYRSDTNELTFEGELWTYNSYVVDPNTNRITINLYAYITTRIDIVNTTVIDTVGTTETTTSTTSTTVVINRINTEISNNTEDVVVVTTQTTDGSGSNDGTTVSPLLTNSVTNSQDSRTIPDPLLIPGSNYIITTYVLTSELNNVLYWIYDVFTNVYPELEQVNDVAIYSDALFPIIPLRENFHSLASHHAEYDETLSLLKLIGVPLESIMDTINENDQVSELKDVYLMNAVSPSTQLQSGLAALYSLFFTFNESAFVTKNAFNTFVVSGIGSWAKRFNLVKFETGNLLQHLVFNYIEITTLNTSKLSVGEYESVLIESPDVSYSFDVGDVFVTDSYSNSSISIYFQETATQQRVITLHGPKMLSLITNRGGQVEIKVAKLLFSGDPQTDPFKIPLTLESVSSISGTDRDSLYFETLQLAFFASISQEIKYYQTKKFADDIQLAIKVVSIVSVIVTLGSASSLSVGLIALGKQLLVGAAFSLLVPIIVEELSLENDLTRALVYIALVGAAVYLSTNGFDFSSMTSVEILKTTSAVLYVSSVALATETKVLQDDYAAFKSVAEERQKVLDDAIEKFESDEGDYSKYALNQQLFTDESPDEFFNRTVEDTNPGVAVYNSLDTYHDQTLQLPKLP